MPQRHSKGVRRLFFGLKPCAKARSFYWHAETVKNVFIDFHHAKTQKEVDCLLAVALTLLSKKIGCTVNVIESTIESENLKQSQLINCLGKLDGPSSASRHPPET